MNWVWRHSLSLLVAGVWLFLLVSSFVMFDETALDWLSERAGGHSDDAFGALLIVLGHKFFWEEGEQDS